jgi:hypothetical protein
MRTSNIKLFIGILFVSNNDIHLEQSIYIYRYIFIINQSL